LKPDAKLDNVLKAALHERVTPAIAATVATKTSRYVFLEGSLERSVSACCDQNTLFDLASLTKVLSTTLICAEAMLLGKIALDETPFPAWPTVTVRHLLQHTSGLPAWRNFYRPHISRDDVFKAVLQTPLEHAPGAVTVYSDLGFIALGHLLESRLKERQDFIFNDLARRYYQTTSLAYRPMESGLDAASVAATGCCPFRRRQLKGEVNDLNAFAQEGVSAHAGLFGTLNDVKKAAHFFLAALKQRETPLQKIIAHFAVAPGKRGLGFDRAEKAGTTDGALSPLCFGHLGFTGTSLWIDPLAARGQGAFFVLLTNHLEMGLRKKELQQLRRDYHRASAQWLRASD
jgi:CubicO group peptidase (beta-lactamase class C family)